MLYYVMDWSGTREVDSDEAKAYLISGGPFAEVPDESVLDETLDVPSEYSVAWGFAKLLIRENSCAQKVATMEKEPC